MAVLNVFAKGVETTESCTPGTWTHNLANAQAYAKKAESAGFFIWCFSFNDGSCKHCDAADSNVFKTSAFKKWSKNNNVAILHASAEESTLNATKKFLSYYTSGGTPTPTFVVADGRDGESRFGTVEYSSSIVQNSIFIDGINLDSFLEQVHACLDHADDVPYSASKQGSKKKLNPQARKIVPNAAADTTLVTNGIWKSYGVNTLNCKHYWVGKNLKATYTDRYDWFAFENSTPGTSYRIVANVSDPKDIGRLCIFPSEEKALASAKNYDACLSNATEVVTMNSLKGGYVFTPAYVGNVYFVFTRRGNTSSAFADYEDIELTYTFTLQEAESAAYFFDPVNEVSFDETSKTATARVYRTNTGSEEDVLVSVDTQVSTAEAGVDYELTTNLVHFAADSDYAEFTVSILPRTGVLTLDKRLVLYVDSPVEPPDGCSAVIQLTIKDNDVVETPNTPENGIELPQGEASKVVVATSLSNVWFKVSEAAASNVYAVCVKPEALKSGVSVSATLCNADGVVLRELGEASVIGETAVFSFAPGEDGAAYINVEASPSSAYDIYGEVWPKPDMADGDSQETAKALAVDADHGVTNWLESGVRCLDGGRTEDWLRISGVSAGKAYRLSAGDVLQVPAGVDAEVALYTNGSPCGLSWQVSALSTDMPCFSLPDGFGGDEVYCRVSLSSDDAEYLQYNIRLREWVRPVIGFKKGKDSVDDTNAVYTVVLVRSENTSLGDVVYVSCDASEGDGEALSGAEAVFMPGEAEASVDFAIACEGKQGLWTGDRTVTFSFELSDPSATAKGGETALALELRDTDFEFEPGDSPAEDAENPLVREEVGPDGVLSTRTLNGADTDDWFVFENAAAETTYRFEIVTNRLANVSEGEVRAEISVPGAEVVTNTFAELRTRLPVLATENGSIAVHVFRDPAAVDAPVSVGYSLKVTTWQRARFSFAPAAYSVDDTNEVVRLVIRRDRNNEEANAVLVSTADGTAKSGASAPDSAFTALHDVRVEFPAGEENDEQEVEVALLPEVQGLWTSNRVFSAVLAVSDESTEVAGVAEASVTLVDVDEASKYDEEDLGDGNPLMAKVYADVTSQQFNSTGIRRLNGDDCVDWYRFDGISAGQNYRFGLVGLQTFNADGQDASVDFFVDDMVLETPVTNVTLAAFAEMTAAGEYLRFKPKTNTSIFVRVKRAASDGPASVLYELIYREAPPSSAHFVADAVTVSELARAVYVDVVCEVEQGQRLFDDVVLRVTPVDGTAVAGRDFGAEPAYVMWSASSEADATGGVRRVAMPLTNLDSVWEGEEWFTLRLSSESDTEVMGIGEMTVTIVDKDAGSYGTVGITMVGDTNSLSKATSSATTPAREGETAVVRVARTGGKRGEVSGVWKWMNGKTQVGKTVETPLFAGASALEPDFVDIELEVPELPGAAAESSLTLNFSISAAAKTVTVTKGSPTALKFSVADKSFAGKVAGYSAGDPSRLALRASGKTWFLATDGSVRSQTPAAGSRTLLSSTVTGPGVLAFDAEFSDAEKCTLVCKVGSSVTNVQGSASGVVAVSVPVASGKQSVSIEFSRPAAKTAATSGAAGVAVSNIEFIPSGEFFKTGTFEGPVSVAGIPGRGMLTVSGKNGKMSGKFVCAGGTLTFSSSSGWQGDSAAVVAKPSGIPVLLTVDPGTGVVTVAPNGGLEVSGTLYRDCWSDLPMSAEAADVLGTAEGYYTVALPHGGDEGYPEKDPEFGSGYLTVTVDSKGKVKAAGVLADGQSVSFGGILLYAGNGMSAYLFSSPSAYRGGWISLPVEFSSKAGSPCVLVRSVSDTPEWQKGTVGEASYEFDRRLAVVGGFYDKVANLRERYVNGLGLAEVDAVSPTTIGSVTTNATAWAGKDEQTAVSLSFNETGRRLVATCAGDRLFTVSFDATTGLFSGSFRAQYDYNSRTVTKSFAYRGVLTPISAFGEDGIAGRGFFLMPEKDEVGKRVEKSYDIAIEER